jgi:LexA-binding, inner membrane-associated putative hydrolase
VSLAWLFVAAQFADLLWPVLLAAGVEEVRIDPGNTAMTPLDFVSYPYSHSLAFLCLWGLVLGVFLGADRRGRPDDGASRRLRRAPTLAVIFALVVSHWFLDFFTHRPDMPMYPGSAKFGLGLWNSVPATMAIEAAMFAAGVWIYARTTRARDRQGRWGLWALVTFLVVVYVANVAGPPPPSVTAIWIVGIAGGLVLLAWSWWVDRHRDGILASTERRLR